MTRRHIRRTAANRYTLPTYAGFSTVTGAVWLFDPGSRIMGSAALRYAGAITPIMGFVLLLIGIALAASLIIDDSGAYETALGVLLGWLSVWGVVLVAAALWGRATWGAWAWPAAIAVFAWASLVSLKAGEGV